MKTRLLILSIFLVLMPVLSHAQRGEVKGVELVALPCFTIKDTIQFYLPEDFEKGDTYWYGEGFAKAYTSESGSHLIIICGLSHSSPALQGKKYVVNSQSGTKREGKIRKTNYLWREEDFSGFIVYYTEVKENEKELFDNIIDEIIAQVKKE